MEGPARYKRAFDWRLKREDGEDTNVAIGALAALHSSEMPDLLVDYLDISRKRRTNHLALARLQTNLVDELVGAEASIKHYREKKAELEQLGNLENGTQKKDTKFVRRELFLWRAFANVLRAIADGVAWRTLGYDRAVMRALCQSRGSQQITSEGTMQELREWGRQFDHGKGIAILNSLTNWLTFGDVTVARNDGSVEIIEVKASSTNSSRVVRQKREMKEVVTFLSTGKGHLEGKTVEVCKLDIVPETGLDILEKLLKETDKPPGHAACRLSNSLYVECIDLRVMTEGADADIVKRRNSLISDWEETDEIHSNESLKSLGFSPNKAPFSIFPFDSALCVDLLLGAKAYMVILNVTAIAREFEYRGWQIVTTPKQAYEACKFEDDFMTVKKDGFVVTLPPAEFMRMGMELLRTQVLIRQCELLRRAGPGA